jgi:hypothetical protein
MIARIQGIDGRHQRVLTPERVQVDDQGLGRLVQLSGSVEELAAKGARMSPT